MQAGRLVRYGTYRWQRCEWGQRLVFIVDYILTGLLNLLSHRELSLI